MQLARSDASIFVPDAVTPLSEALGRTTHLGIGAHADDLEILAIDGILRCHEAEDAWFTGAVVTDGAGSARAGRYADVDDARMRELRVAEQEEAARLGRYGAMIQLGHPSSVVKAAAEVVVEDLRAVLEATRPSVVYTHNLADRHDTHVAVALSVLRAAASLPAEARPRRILGCEVWRDLDWLTADDCVALPVDEHEALQGSLLRVFDSQIAGGKRYDVATLARRAAHATFADSHAIDGHRALVLAMDLTSLMDTLDFAGHARALIRRFEADVLARIARLER